MIKNFLKNHHVHQKIVPYLDTFFIYNPTLFFTVWVMIFIGMYIGHQNILISPQWVTSQLNFKILLLFVALICSRDCFKYGTKVLSISETPK